MRKLTDKQIGKIIVVNMLSKSDAFKRDHLFNEYIKGKPFKVEEFPVNQDKTYQLVKISPCDDSGRRINPPRHYIILNRLEYRLFKLQPEVQKAT